jgi:hypothetical protein
MITGMLPGWTDQVQARHSRVISPGSWTRRWIPDADMRFATAGDFADALAPCRRDAGFWTRMVGRLTRGRRRVGGVAA